MTHSIEWRQRALKDVWKILDYIGKDSVSRAEQFGNTLKNKVAVLATHPLLGRIGRIPHTRELVVHENYIVVYRLLKGKKIVQIISVKHVAQQI